MYNLEGILYRALSPGLFILILGVLVLITSKIRDSKTRNKKLVIKNKEKADVESKWVAIAAIVFALLYMLFYVYKYNNPTIVIHEGYYVEEYRNTGAGLKFQLWYDYVFTDGDNPKPSYHMDASSRKEIYPDEFSSEVKYRIYYERDTKIIVRVEPIEESVAETAP